MVRDDGDVEAYRTRHIYEAICRRRHPGNELGLRAVDVKPFFHRNVGASAWGLAIHSEARMIAVSSNLHEVTIYAFALHDNSAQDADDFEDLPAEAWPVTRSTDPNIPEFNAVDSRKQDQVRIIQNGPTNIPDIAFCNTGDDTEGRWLLTTDISGTTRLWDVHRLSREEMTKMRWSSARAGSGLRADSGLGFDGFDRLNAGWGVLFLDSRSFCKVNNILDAVGTHLSQHTADAQIWDISDAVQNLPDQGPIYAQIADSQPNNVMDGNFNDPAPLAPIPRSHPLQTRDSPTIPATHAGPSNDVSSGVDEDEEMDEDEEIDENEGSDSGQAADDSPEGSEYTQDYTDQELEEPAFLSIHRDCNLALHDRLPCPILHTSLSNLYLFQPSPAGTLPAGTPLLMLADPWQQSLPLEHYWLQRMQRCNMLAQIPSLSVVIVGNQKGRVLILSLTQVHSMDKHVYAFRIAHMLPRRNQELAGHRPMSPLHGIAVGPMQGTENLPDNKKRWRLMIMYQDHTVLSYEFGKSDHDLELREVMI